MHVLEVWPEPGWYTEVIAPLVRDRGKYYAGVIAPDPASRYIANRLDGYRSKLASRPDLYDRVAVVTFPTDGGDVLPANSARHGPDVPQHAQLDGAGTRPQAFATMYRALKPGGVLGVVEHRGNAGCPAGPAGQERLRRRGLRHQADRGAGLQARGEIRR